MIKFSAYVLFIVLALCARVAVANDNTVLWPVSSFPPFNILEGEFRNQGVSDVIRQILFKRLPEFHHVVIEASASRALDMVKTRQNACIPNLFKTPERETTMEFSTSLMGIMPNGLVTLRSHFPLLKPFLNEQRELRLGDFLDDGRYHVATITGRSFGPGIDAVLGSRKGKPSISIVPSSDHFATRLLKLLNQNEYQGIVGYATELRYVVRERKLNSDDFVFVPLVEERMPIQMYVGCSKSEVGKQVIAGINRVLSDPNVRREIHASYRFWLDDDTAKRFDRFEKQSQPRHSTAEK